jgi:hypothetical protein
LKLLNNIFLPPPCSSGLLPSSWTCRARARSQIDRNISFAKFTSLLRCDAVLVARYESRHLLPSMSCLAQQ